MLLSARPAQHELGCLSGGDMLDAPVAEARKIETGEETFAASKQDRRDHDMHIVDHPGTQVLLDGACSEGNLRTEAGTIARKRPVDASLMRILTASE